MNQQAHFSHYVPLLLFTAMLLIAAGIVMAVEAAHLFLPGAWDLEMALLAMAFVLAAVGGAISFLHLGRKERAVRAALGLAHSWLSREAILAALFAGAALAALLFRISDLAAIWFTVFVVVASVSGLLTAIAIGKLYDLEAQAGWRGWAQALTAPVSALLLAAALFIVAPGSAEYAPVFYVVWLADVVLLGFRDSGYRRNVREGAMFSFPKLSRAAKFAYNFRKLFSIAALVAVVSSTALIAVAAIAVAICLDRFCLYAASVQSTPSSEITALKAERMRQALG